MLGVAPMANASVAPFLIEAAAALLKTLENDWPEREGAWASAQSLYRLRWPWSPAVADRLRRPERDERWLFSKLPEWEENGGRAQPRSVRIQAHEVAARLADLTGKGAEPTFIGRPVRCQ